VLAAQQKFNLDAVDKGLASSDLLYQQLQKALLAAQAEAANQKSVIAQAKVAEGNAYSEYQNTSAIVYAPASGTVQDISYEQGAYIASSGGGTSGTGTSVAALKTTDKLTAKINVSELDIANVSVGQNVVLTLTALSGKTYHGKVVSVASSGSTDSNITTFPVVIEITDATPNIRIGMAVSGDITVQSKENVLAVSNQAITTANDKHTVVVMTKDGKQKTVTVTVGLILDTQSEITSGLTEGDKVVLASSGDDTSSESAADGPSTKKPTDN
jgi:RND family efflux transporter MFP subunit